MIVWAFSSWRNACQRITSPSVSITSPDPLLRGEGALQPGRLGAAVEQDGLATVLVSNLRRGPARAHPIDARSRCRNCCRFPPRHRGRAPWSSVIPAIDGATACPSGRALFLGLAATLPAAASRPRGAARQVRRRVVVPAALNPSDTMLRGRCKAESRGFEYAPFRLVPGALRLVGMGFAIASPWN